MMLKYCNYFQSPVATEPELQLVQKTLSDLQLVKESLQDELRAAYNVPSMQRMIDALSEMTKIQQYLKLALIKSPEIAARYAQATDNELDFSTAEMAKIASLEKEVEKKKSSGAGRKRSVDKTNDTCNQCDQKGHWKWDRDSNGKYICPKQQ